MLCISTSEQVLRWSKSSVSALKQVFSSFSVTNEQKRKESAEITRKTFNVSKHELRAQKVKKGKDDIIMSQFKEYNSL